MADSPTTRSLALLRSRGYTAEVVERWIPNARKRHDLFGFIDIVALRGAETLSVQACAAASRADRVRKIADSPLLPIVREAGWRVVVIAWRKNARGRWVASEVDVS